jgi:hypothetical protein
MQPHIVTATTLNLTIERIGEFFQRERKFL